MNTEEILFKKRLSELANKSYTNSQYLFTTFLALSELDLYYHYIYLHRLGYLSLSCQFLLHLSYDLGMTNMLIPSTVEVYSNKP